jgi:glycosyltransferase involved in cell wall biosynthesis
MPLDRPAVSVIIPTYKRPQSLKRCLKSLMKQSLPAGDFEVIAVDDGGPGGLPEELQKYHAPLRLRLLEQEHRGPARARNLGARHARGAYLAFIDDDCRAEPLWLAGLMHGLQKGPGRAVGGLTLNGLPGNPYAAASQLLHDQFSKWENSGPQGVRFIASNNFALSAKEFEALGGFDESFKQAGGEDREFCRRWLLAGKTLEIRSDARIWHYHDMGLRGFWRQQMSYGRGGAGLLSSRKPAPGGSPGQKLRFSLGLVPAVWRDPKLNRKLALSMLCLLSQLAVGAGYIRTFQRRPDGLR